MLKRVICVSLLILLIGCSHGGEERESFCTNDALKVEVLGTSSVTHEGTDYAYRLLKLRCGKNVPAYAQFFEPPSQKKSPCVMHTMPYAIITWTGDPSDQEYANTSGTPPLEPDDQVEAAFPYLLNGFGVLFVYGRFYQGGSIVNEVNDMIAGLKYLEGEDLADNSRLAIMGFSWGGFEAIYGACYAPQGSKPLVGVAYFPVTDFKKWYEHIAYPQDYISSQDKIDEYKAFFRGNLDRIEAHTGGTSRDPRADFTGFQHSRLGNKLNTDFMILHDSWDTLVPLEQSKDFYNANRNKISPIWFYHDTPIDYETAELSHSDLFAIIDYGNPQVKYAIPAYYPMAHIFMYKRLASQGQSFIVSYDAEPMERFISYVKEFKEQGHEMEWAAERFLDFFDDRIVFWGLSGQINKTGGEIITEAFNNAWGTSYSEGELENLLQNGLP